MMRTGAEKPPLAPKPKIIQTQKTKPPPVAPKPDVLSQPPSVEERGVKPPIAPKPYLHQDSTTSALSRPQTNGLPSSQEKLGNTNNVGLLNSRNGVHLGPKKREWDYIIPICVCNRDDCQQCTPKENSKQAVIGHLGKGQRSRQNEDFRKPMPKGRTKLDKELDTLETKKGFSNPFNPSSATLQSVLNNSNHVQRVPEVTENQSNPIGRHNDNTTGQRNITSKVKCTPLQRTWSDEVNGNTHRQFLRTAPEPSDNHRLVSVPTRTKNQPVIPPSLPTAPQKPLPVPAPRRPRALAPVQQVDAKKTQSEMRSRGVDLTEASTLANVVNIMPISVEHDCLYETVETGYVDLYVSSASRKTTENQPARLGQTDIPRIAEYFYESTEFSVDDDDDNEVDVGNRDSSCTVSQPKQPKLVNQLAVSTRVSEKLPKTFPEKQHGQHSLTVMSQNTNNDENISQIAKDNERCLSPASKEPDNNKSKSTRKQLSNFSSANTKGKLFGQNLKPRAKSFTSVDLLRPDGIKKTSLRKFLDINISVKKLPKLLTKRGQAIDRMSVEMEESVDADTEGDEGPVGKAKSPVGRKFSCPVIGLEQSVDGEDIFPGAEAAVEYENIPIYEDIPEYMNIPCSNNVASSSVTPTWQSSSWTEEENIYEEQEPYELIGEDAAEAQKHFRFQRNSIEENVGQGYGHSEEEICHSSEDDDDRSSNSSKEDQECSEHNNHLEGTKKSKVVHIAREIMSSEKVFVDVLKLLNIDFREAVAKASQQTGKPVIEDRNLNQILYYLPQLYELNHDLLKELEERVAKWDQHSQLADIFVKKGPYLKMYSTYIREFDKNVALLDEQCRKNSGFATAVREFEASPRCANLALKHYLLKPIQRIPQYQLLLTDYLKNLTEDSTDYKDTQAALNIVKEVANHANDIMKQGDNFQKLMQVQCRLSGHHEIVQPGRVFLKEGILMKLSRKVMQPRMFFLFNDALLYTTPVQSGQFKLNNMLSLAGMKVTRPSQEGYQNELNIESVERSFILSASSEAERDDWLEAISNAISEYTKKMITFISSRYHDEGEGDGSGAPLGSKAPIWIPDLRATMCMICTCEFTLTWRRHHCRACGKVVCQTCSSNKHQLEYLKSQLARVCDQCFVTLQKRTADRNHATGGQTPNSASSTGKSPGAFPFRKTKRIPAALKEVSANTDESSMSGYLERSKGNKKQWKRFWFVIKDKVLYTYAASEDVAALESQPLLGFSLMEDKSGSAQSLQFKLYHKNTLYYLFKADDIHALERWTEAFQEAMVL